MLKEVGLEELIALDYRSYINNVIEYIKNPITQRGCKEKLAEYLKKAQVFNSIKVKVLEEKIRVCLLNF